MRLARFNQMREDLYERISNYINLIDENNIDDYAKKIRKDFKLEVDYYDCSEEMIMNIIKMMLEFGLYVYKDRYLTNKQGED